MKFLIQHNLMGEEQLRLTKHAVEPFPHEFVGLIPFSREITSNEPLEGTDYIPYGSTLLTNLAYELGWRGCHFDLNKFNYRCSMAHRPDMLNGGQQALWTIKGLIEFLKTLPMNKQLFIRPSADLKQFSGQIIEAGEGAAWLEDAMLCDSSGTYKLDEDTEIIIAEPKAIQAEWRWFVIGGKVVDGSMYRARGQLVKVHEDDPTVITEAQQVADVWLPDPCCVMDLALVDDELKVIEFNCINSSGFYNHDVDLIFKRLYEHEQERLS